MITEEIREARRKGLGGSDIAGIIPCKTSPTGTLSPWMTAVGVWNSKMNATDDGAGDTEATWWGSHEEDLVAKRFTELTGKRLVNHRMMIVDGCLLANLDRLVIPDGQKTAAYRGQIRTNEIFEAKTSGSEWERSDAVSILPNGTEIRDGSLGIPAHYQTQCFHYMGRVPTAERIFVAVKMAIPCGRFARTDFAIYVLERNDEIIRAQDDYARNWWDEHIIHAVKPEPVCDEDCKILWRRSTPASHVFLSRDILSAYNRMKDAQAAKNAAKADEEAAKAELQKAMGDKECILGNDGKTILATWKSEKPKTVKKVNWEDVAIGLAGCYSDGGERLKKNIELFTETTTKEGARKFLLKTSDSVLDYVARAEFDMEQDAQPQAQETISPETATVAAVAE